MDQAIILAPNEKPKITPKNRCTYCKSTQHKVAENGDVQGDYLRPQP